MYKPNHMSKKRWELELLIPLSKLTSRWQNYATYIPEVIEAANLAERHFDIHCVNQLVINSTNEFENIVGEDKRMMFIPMISMDAEENTVIVSDGKKGDVPVIKFYKL